MQNWTNPALMTVQVQLGALLGPLRFVFGYLSSKACVQGRDLGCTCLPCLCGGWEQLSDPPCLADLQDHFASPKSVFGQGFGGRWMMTMQGSVFTPALSLLQCVRGSGQSRAETACLLPGTGSLHLQRDGAARKLKAKENPVKQRNLALLWLEMFGLTLKLPLSLLDLSPSTSSFCRQIFPPPRLWLICQGCFVTFKVWVMLALWREAPGAEKPSFPRSDAPSQGEDVGAEQTPARRWDRFGCSSAERCRAMPQEPQPISASLGTRLRGS